MADAAEHWVTVATRLTEARVNELALVLTARGVPYQRQLASAAGSYGCRSPWLLRRPPSSRSTGTRTRGRSARGLSRRWARAGPACVWYGARLLAVFFALHTDLFNRDWLGAGRLEAGALLRGEWWRAVTALTLHIELDHLGGNLAFGGFFGYFIGRYLGPGVGWLAVLLAAGGANVLNAWAQGAAHRSIGASTAVFAALGLLAAYTWRRGFLRDTPWRARIAPIVAGLGLLGVHGHCRREHRPRCAPVRLHRGDGAGRRDCATRADARGSSTPRVQRLCGAARRSRARGGLGRGIARGGLALERVGDELEKVALVRDRFGEPGIQRVAVTVRHRLVLRPPVGDERREDPAHELVGHDWSGPSSSASATYSASFRSRNCSL